MIVTLTVSGDNGKLTLIGIVHMYIFHYYYYDLMVIAKYCILLPKISQVGCQHTHVFQEPPLMTVISLLRISSSATSRNLVYVIVRGFFFWSLIFCDCHISTNSLNSCQFPGDVLASLRYFLNELSSFRDWKYHRNHLLS